MFINMAQNENAVYILKLIAELETLLVNHNDAKTDDHTIKCAIRDLDQASIQHIITSLNELARTLKTSIEC